jgi:hypothetical protein
MPLNSSGPISLGGNISGQSINLELGQSPFAQVSLDSFSSARNYVAEVPGPSATGTVGLTSGTTGPIVPISFDNFYGKSYKRVVGFTTTTTWTAPTTGTYRLYAVGGGGGASPTFNGNFYGSGGGSGIYATTTVSITAGDVLTISIGGGGGGSGSGGTTTIVRSGVTLLSAAGGSPGGNGVGGAGGSGGGVGPANSDFRASLGGYNGSNGQSAAGVGGTGQLGAAYGLGTNTYIPPGGSGGYLSAPGPSPWSGILGFGAGNQAGTDQNGQCAGGGAGGGNWAGTSRVGAAGLVVVYG